MPPSKINGLKTGTFYEEFSEYLENLSCARGKVIILGDFNIIFLDTSGFAYIRFVDILETFDRVQHIDKPTHNSGHLLFFFFFGLEDLYLTKRIDRKHNIHSHKYNHTRTFICTYTHTINRNMHWIDYIINWKKIHLICLLISIHIPVIYKHILNIEKYHIIVSIGVEDNVMHTVSW